MNAELRRHMTADERRQHAQDCQRAHAEGYLAREDGVSREANLYPARLGEAERHHWWAAGWHDKDQELDTRRATA